MSVHLAAVIRCGTCRSVCAEVWLEPVSGERFDIRSNSDRDRLKAAAPTTQIDVMASKFANLFQEHVDHWLRDVDTDVPSWMRERMAKRHQGRPWCTEHSYVLSQVDAARIDVACRPIDVEALTPVQAMEYAAGRPGEPLVVVGRRV